MFRSFFPDEYLDSAYVIDYEKLYREGYRGLLFDIDNTIVPHGAPADERARKLFEKLRGIGFRYCFVSNNQKPRVEPFAKAVEGNFIENAHKPAVKNYKKACQPFYNIHRDSFEGSCFKKDILLCLSNDRDTDLRSALSDCDISYLNCFHNGPFRYGWDFISHRI